MVEVVGLGLATLDVLMRMGEMPTWEHSTPLSAFSLDGGGPVGKTESLSENGVDLSRLVRRPGPETQVVQVYGHEETGERIFSIRSA